MKIVQEPIKQSPGPGGYYLPTGVGKNGHDPTKKIAPSFSFGSRYNKFSDQSPGPIYQVDPSLTNKGKGYSPRYTLKSRWTPKKITFVTPAPNYIYEETGTTKYKKSPHYTFAGRAKADDSTAGPGPMRYTIPYNNGSKAALMIGRNDKFGYAHDYANTPGPATSDGIGADAILKRQPAFTMKGRTRLPENKLITPGPGAYDAKAFGYASPRFSMGVRHGLSTLPVYTLADVSD